MSEDYKKVLEAQLWNIANTLRGKMNADEFRDYILGFIFYKYLSEKMNIFAEEILKQDNIRFRDIKPKTADGKEFKKDEVKAMIFALGDGRVTQRSLVTADVFPLTASFFACGLHTKLFLDKPIQDSFFSALIVEQQKQP